jgi:phage terminase large subunit GpA-like protein
MALDIKTISDANIAKLIAILYAAAQIPEPVSLPQWADDVRILSPKNSSRPGKWQTSRVEVARGPMLAVTEPGVRVITLEVATQIMKTAFIENVIGRFIHIDPCPMLAVYPDDASAEGFSKERLSPLIDETPELRAIVAPPKSRDSANTIGQKHFPGGFIAVEGAGSDVGLAMRPIRVTFCDEIDKWRANKGGDPLKQAEERTSTFVHNSLNIRCCSPRLEETSRIHASYLTSDMRKAFLACPHCSFEQVVEFFSHVHWDKVGKQHLTETARIECQACNKPWTERQRKQAIQRVKWFQTKKFFHCREEQDPMVNRLWEYDPERNCGYALCRRCKKRAVPVRHAGFNVSKIYSPNLTMAELAAMWIESKDDPDMRQAFYNQQLAMPFKAEITKKIDADQLTKRREVMNGIPDGVVVLTTGVDVHPTANDRVGRIEIETVGWSETLESWSIDYHVLIGDPAQPVVWDELDQYLLKHWDREDGRKMKIMAACVDSGGHNTEEVYAFCRPRASRNIWAIKGASDRQGQWSPVWPQRHLMRTKKFRKAHGRDDNRYRPVVIGVNAAKEAVRQRLLIEEAGPGYCHFPADRPDGYFDQLTSERLTIQRKAGITFRVWEKPNHLANEALDVRVYAYAALQGLIIDRGFNLARVARMLRKAAAESEAERPAASIGQTVGTPEPPQSPPPAIVEKAAALVAPAKRLLPIPARRVSSYATRRYY